MAGIGALSALGALHTICLARVRVEGPSMEPTLVAGDRLLVRRTRRLSRGDVVVCPDPTFPGRLLVKRVVALEADLIFLSGDNPTLSRDSRQFGPVARDAVLGVAWYRYLPAERAGFLHRM